MTQQSLTLCQNTCAFEKLADKATCTELIGIGNDLRVTEPKFVGPVPRDCVFEILKTDMHITYYGLQASRQIRRLPVIVKKFTVQC